MPAPVSPGLCGSCQHASRITSDRGATFVVRRMFPPGPLDDKPATFIAAFKTPAGDAAWLAPLVQITDPSVRPNGVADKPLDVDT